MAEERVQRRLAAILAADVVGYSRLIEADEERTRARLRVLLFELVEPLVAADGGRIFKTMGDGFLVEFPSVVRAVHAALSLQHALRQRNAPMPAEIRIELRVGVNLGDVIVEGDDIHGDGVNVAARVEGLCEPGSVYVSGPAADQAKGKLDASFEDLGEHTVKNIGKLIRVYRASESSQPASEQDRGAPDIFASRPDQPSIAVLPFENMSGDPEQEYFSNGMAEDLITDISKLSGVAVTARNSSFAFKGQAIDVMEIAKKLRVNHVVEGSVRKMGDRLRINAQLIDGSDGRHIWAERYDGSMSEIFQFQDDIREKIVAALKVSLTPVEAVLSHRKPTDSVEAYDLFLKGRASYYLYTPTDLERAINYFEKAIEIDRQFADAYGFLSYCKFSGYTRRLPKFDDGLVQANELAEVGVALDGNSAIALSRLGWSQLFLRRYEEAISNLKRAFELAPSNVDVISSLAQALNYLGNPEEGRKLQEAAFSIEPFVSPNWYFHLGTSYFLLRNYDKSIEMFERSLPNVFFTYLILACAYVEAGRLREAKDAIEKQTKIVPDYTIAWVDKFLPFRNDSDRCRVIDGLRTAGLPE